MATYSFALISAAIVILIALASKAGYIPRDLASFLILTLPIIPVIILSRRRGASCNRVEG